jgi:pimeloyl-ACP methyl ester carboxylesterase
MIIHAGEAELELRWEMPLHLIGQQSEAAFRSAYHSSIVNRKSSIHFDFLIDNDKPTLYIIGTQDEFCPRDKMEQFARRLPPTSAVSWVEGADHFFTLQVDLVQDRVREFLKAQFKGQRP